MADISYTPTTWANGAEGGTAIDAAKLNNIESGIVDAVAAIGPNDTTEDGSLKEQIDALGVSVSQSATLSKTVLYYGAAGNDTLAVPSMAGFKAFGFHLESGSAICAPIFITAGTFRTGSNQWWTSYNDGTDHRSWVQYVDDTHITVGAMGGYSGWRIQFYGLK